MSDKLTTFGDDARIALANLADYATGLVTPTVRLGVTGLSRAGKTVFITALVHNLVHGGRLPVFEAAASSRLAKATREPQPDDAVPTFAYDDHVATLVDQRAWPQSTRRISQMRLTLAFESASWLSRNLGGGRLHLDIVDYPGEWLLDLPLLTKDYATWSREAIELSRLPNRVALAAQWHARMADAQAAGPENETVARELASAFTDYLRACRADEHALSTLPPGRFLMPGDLEGSPALTFAPLAWPDGPGLTPGRTLFQMMERRYEAYKDVVVRPFFRDHFARLDRQIVLVDALSALNAGAGAVRDLETALADILACFRTGQSSWLSSLVSRRIDRIVFAATKADHLHHSSHDRLEAILRRLVRRAADRAAFSGAEVDVIALAAVRATREAMVKHDGATLPAIFGVPLAGETMDGETFDGTGEVAVFPGDLPTDLERLFGAVDTAATAQSAVMTPLRFLRFRPPKLEVGAEGLTLSLPHIRLDKALQFLLGDKLA
jgi:uncharacterized protein